MAPLQTDAALLPERGGCAREALQPPGMTQPAGRVMQARERWDLSFSSYSFQSLSPAILSRCSVVSPCAERRQLRGLLGRWRLHAAVWARGLSSELHFCRRRCAPAQRQKEHDNIISITSDKKKKNKHSALGLRFKHQKTPKTL